jgi:phosphohistidine phosphatase
MEIFLVRHGQAVTAPDEPRHPLSQDGIDSVGRIAAWAQEAGVRVRQIRHSGKLRAEQTAQILAEHLKPPGGSRSVSGLGPHDDVTSVGRMAADELANSMWVGHLPFLGRLAAFLVTGDPEIQLVRFCAAGIVCLQEEQGNWLVHWVMTPDLLPP